MAECTLRERDVGGRLVLVRHAKSDYPWGVEDHDRPLNARGRRDAPEAGRWLSEHVSWTLGAPPVVIVSSARRAQLTWGLMRTALTPDWDAAVVVDEPRIYEADVADILIAVTEGVGASDTAIVIGHNPGLAQMVQHCARAGRLRDEAVSSFRTSAIAVLTSDDPLQTALEAPQQFDVRAFAVPRG
mgnify:CR=1 FL=1